MGYEVLEARNGKEALAIADKEPVDLVITDIVMPEKEGLETISALKQKIRGIKVVAMSGGGRGSASDYLRLATMMGANRVMLKPFSNDSLAAVLGELLGEK
jgi:YesN/AraC family two-component response regulator